MSSTHSNPRAQSVAPFVFGFFVALAVLGLAAFVAGYVIAALRGGGAGLARLAPWVVVGSAVAAVAASPLVHMDGQNRGNETRGITLGVAAAAVLTAFGVTSRDFTNLSNVGPLQLTVATLSILVALSAPLLGRTMVRFRLADRIASSMIQPKNGAAEPIVSTSSSVNTYTLLGGAIALAIGLAIVLATGPLGHDESVYALKARSWLEGTPATGWEIYRPIGVSIIGWVVLQFSASEVAFRSAAIALSIATVATMWFTGRIMFTTSAAWIGTAVFVASASYLRRATEFLNDLAAAGFLIATMLAIWYYFERRPQSWWLVAAAPLAASAYYMRYGSALGLAVIGLFTVIVWGPNLLRSWRQIITTAAATLALLAPHFVYALDQTGSITGIFRSASTSVGGGGGGLGHYVEWLPRHLAGRLGAAVMLAAAIYTVVVIVRAVRSSSDSDIRPEARTVAFLTGVAITLTIALGLFTHGEPRFVFMPLMAILLVGGQALVGVASRLQRTPKLVLASMLAISIAVFFSGSIVRMSQGMDRITGQRDVIVGAADAVRNDVGGGDCVIRSSYVPQLTWYAVCSTYTFSQPAPAVDPAYLIVFENGKRQPTGSELENEITAADDDLVAVVDDPYDKIGDGYIYRYPPSR